jgi:type III secretion system FlhB-like substrate exporter
MKRRKVRKRKTASAIGYAPEEGAPRLLAQGRDRAAERIIAIAGEAGVPVLEDPALAALLESGIRPGELIPVWCWEAVAKILAFVLAENSGKERAGITF